MTDPRIEPSAVDIEDAATELARVEGREWPDDHDRELARVVLVRVAADALRPEPPGPCSTCDGMGYVLAPSTTETADTAVSCPDCGGATARPEPQGEQLAEALRELAIAFTPKIVPLDVDEDGTYEEATTRWGGHPVYEKALRALAAWDDASHTAEPG